VSPASRVTCQVLRIKAEADANAIQLTTMGETTKKIAEAQAAAQIKKTESEALAEAQRIDAT
jgi:hypothetical protein